MQATGQEVKVVARAFLPGATVSFQGDGTATWTEAYTLECDRCGAVHDVEGGKVSFTPDLAWGLLQALRRSLSPDAYREAAQAITRAIEGPRESDGKGAEILLSEDGSEFVWG